MPVPAARDRGAERVTNVELFFDLVYVFAVTQLSHLLVSHPDAEGAWHAAVLLAMVWQVWVYTTWAVNYLNPEHDAVRVMLLALMLGSLVLAAALPHAFGDEAGLVAGVYVAMQLGRTVFALVVLRGHRLRLVFARILPWLVLTGALVVLGAFADPPARAALWAASVAIDLVAASFGFWCPGLGRSSTTDWTISGSHFAERCQAFVLIALGESVVVVGGLAHLEHPSARDVLAFGAAFAGAVTLWWVYFDRTAEDSTRRIAQSDDPGRLGRDAFHWVHPLIIAGIIVTAAADEKVLEDPGAHADGAVAWFLLGGTALFLAGHAAFKAVVWRIASWPRIVATAVLLALVPVGPHASRLALGALTLAVVVAVAIADRVQHPAEPAPTPADKTLPPSG